MPAPFLDRQQKRHHDRLLLHLSEPKKGWGPACTADARCEVDQNVPTVIQVRCSTARSEGVKEGVKEWPQEPVSWWRLCARRGADEGVGQKGITSR